MHIARRVGTLAVFALILSLVAPARAGMLDKMKDFKKPNIKIGKLELHPHYKLTETYDSNIFLAPRSKVLGNNADSNKAGPVLGSWITENNLGLKASFPLTEMHKLELGYDFVWKAYKKDPRLNNTVNQAVDAAYSYKGPNVSAKVADTYVNTVDPATSELTARQKRWQNTATAEGEYAPEGGKLFAGADVSQTNHKYVSQSVALRTALNRYEQSFGVKGGYRVRPKTRVYAAYHRQIIHYSVHQSAPTKNNKAHFLDFGVEGDIAPKLTGQVQTGLQYRQYDDPPAAGQKKITRNWMLATKLTYKPLERTKVDLSWTRRIEESTFLANQFYIANAASLNVTHKLPHKLTAGVNAGLEIDKYPEATATGGSTANRRDDLYQTGASLDYDIQEYLRTGISYTYRTRNSRFTEQFNYNDHLTSLSLSLLF